ERYLQKYNPGIKVAGVCDSIETSVSWLEQNQSTIDLIFMDIQLKDGLSFKIFQEVKVEKPVIFITAYNEYALEAFKVNSIDYLNDVVMYSNSRLKVSTQPVWDKEIIVSREKVGEFKEWFDGRVE